MGAVEQQRSEVGEPDRRIKEKEDVGPGILDIEMGERLICKSLYFCCSDQVKSGNTGNFEAVQIKLEFFFHDNNLNERSLTVALVITCSGAL